MLHGSVVATEAALNWLLRLAAAWVGATPDEASIVMSRDFIETAIDPKAAETQMRLWQAGAISRQTLYENLQQGEIAGADRTYEEESQLIDDEGGDLSQLVPAMSYVQLAQVTKNLMLDPMLVGRAYLVVDAGGPGRAYADLLNAKDCLHTRMQIVSGENESETTERGIKFNNVSKNLLLGSFNSALHTGDLLIGDIPMRAELQAELESFEASVGLSGRMRLTGGTAGGHADAAMAAAMAFWLSDHRSVGAHVGETKLRGYW